MDKVLVSLPQTLSALTNFTNAVYSPKVPASGLLMYHGKIAVAKALLANQWGMIADSNGMINASIFYDQYQHMFTQRDSVEAFGFTFDKDDLNEFMKYIKQEAHKNNIQPASTPTQTMPQTQPAFEIPPAIKP